MKGLSRFVLGFVRCGTMDINIMALCQIILKTFFSVLFIFVLKISNNRYFFMTLLSFLDLNCVLILTPCLRPIRSLENGAFSACDDTSDECNFEAYMHF